MPDFDHCFDPAAQWVCQDALLPDEGCYIGSVACDDEVDMLVETLSRRIGTHWIKAAEKPGFPSRDAHGVIRPIKSNRPHLLPDLQFFRYAACGDSYGKECPDEEHCDCYPGAQIWLGEDNPDCRHGADYAALGTYPGCYMFNGHNWPPGLWCRSVDFGGSMSATFPYSTPNAQKLNQAEFLRLYPSACAGHWNPPCMAKKPGTGDYYVHLSGGEGNEQIWNYLDINWHDVRFLDDERPWRMTDLERGRLAALNAVLEWIMADAALGIAGQTGFDRVDKNWLGSLDAWDRTFNPTHGAMMPVVYEYPNSYLLHSGTPLEAKLHLEWASLQVSLVFERSDPTPLGIPAGSEPERVRPYVRFLLEARLHMRIKNADTGELSAEVQVPQPDGSVAGGSVTFTGDGWAIDELIPAGLDHIVYVDSEGRVCIPPTQAHDGDSSLRWWASMGAFSRDGPDEEEANIWTEVPAGYSQTLWGNCCNLAWRMSQQNEGLGLKVEGMPSRVHVRYEEDWTEVGATQQIHGGHVFLQMPTAPGSNFAAKCDEYV